MSGSETTPEDRCPCGEDTIKGCATRPSRHCPGSASSDAVQARFAPGTFGCHEALHMASVLADAVDEQLCDHLAIKLRADWLAKADAARDALFDLYNAIGREHL